MLEIAWFRLAGIWEERCLSERPVVHVRSANLRTLAITWPQGVISQEKNLAEAAQVNGGVSWPHLRGL